MCGIAGVAGAELASKEELQVRSCLECLTHRGPDDEGIAFFQTPSLSVILGHRRLSILDLSCAGHQPMQSPSGRYSVVFNGEIFNYLELRKELASTGTTFSTNSDTEVLLAAWERWKTAAIPRLRGMFAFAMFDRKEASLTCVRDQFGIKPFYYGIEGGRFHFASEPLAMQSLSRVYRNINSDVALNFLLTGRTSVTGGTFFSAIKSLPPGHLIRVAAEGTTAIVELQSWAPTRSPSCASSTDGAPEIALRRELIQSVAIHLRSDVPVAFSLSGGIDSTALVSIARRIEPTRSIQCFSFIDDSQKTEKPWVELAHDSLNLDVSFVRLQKEFSVDMMDELILQQGEPFSTFSIAAQSLVYRQASRAGYPVVIDGQGADELLGGYDGFPAPWIVSTLREREFQYVYRFITRWPQWPGRSGKLLAYSLARELISPRGRAILRAMNAPFGLGFRNSVFSGVDPLGKGGSEKPGSLKQRLDFQAHLEEVRNHGPLQDLLRYADRNSMAWSVEGRFPFLDQQVARTVTSLSAAKLVSPEASTKELLRRALCGIAPPEILSRRDKIGFHAESDSWIRREAGFVKPWLSGLEAVNGLNATRARNYVESRLNSSDPLGPEVWRLLVLGRWVQLCT